MQAMTFFRWMTLVSYFSLTAFIFISLIWINPPAVELRSLALIWQVGPLMFPLRGILHGRAYTHAWASYLALFYLVYGIWHVGGEATRTYGMLVTLLSIGFFTGCVFYARLKGKADKAASEA